MDAGVERMAYGQQDQACCGHTVYDIGVSDA